MTQPSQPTPAPSPLIDGAVIAELPEQVRDGGGPSPGALVDTYLSEAATSVQALASTVTTNDLAKTVIDHPDVEHG